MDTTRRRNSTFTVALDAPYGRDTEQSTLSVDKVAFGRPTTLFVAFDPKKPTLPSEPDFPDGGLRAWSVVIGAILMSFATFGWINSFGVFQTYYQTNTLQDLSASTIAWIGSTQYGLIFVPALFTGRLLDLGYYKVPLAISSVIYVIALFLVAECKTYTQFMLCQGVATGLFAGMIFGTCPAVVSHWFLKKRSLAYGVFSIGSSIGGTILPIMAQQLLNKVGFKWAIRITAFVLTLAVFAANLLLRTRLPPSNVKGGLFNWAAFKNPAFTCCVIAYNVVLLGLFSPLIFLDLSAQAAGISPNFSFYLISIANCSSLIGRLSSGILADRYGALNMLIPTTVIGGLMSFAWPYVTSQVAPLVVVTIIYGATTGAFISLLPSTPARLGGMSDAGRRIGMAITATFFGAAVGPPLSGVIQTASGGFKDVGFYSGGVVMIGCILMIITRRLALGKWTGRF